MAAIPKDLTSQAEAAKQAGITRFTLWERIKRERIKTYKQFGRRLVSLSEVLNYEPAIPGPKPRKASAPRNSRDRVKEAG